MLTLFKHGTTAAVATAALLAVAVPSLTHAATSSAEESNATPADKAVAARVHAALAADPMSYYEHVTVSADNGAVTLGGFVASPTAQAKAKKIAAGVQGVTKVVDQMQLQPPGYEGHGNQ